MPRTKGITWALVWCSSLAVVFTAWLFAVGAAAGPPSGWAAPAAPNAILWYQWDGAGVNSTNSQNYERDLESLDDQAADDFRRMITGLTSPGTSWSIRSISTC